MKKLPRIYQGDFYKEIRNNKEVEYVKEGDVVDQEETQDIESFLDQLFSSSRHSFHVPVIIKTKNRVYDTKIAGRVKNYIITLDNDIIYFSDIISMKEKQ